MPLNFELSVNPACVGKDNKTIGLSHWQRAFFTPSELIRYVYIDGLAHAAGLFSGASKIDNAWVGGELVIIDIDKAKPNLTLDLLLADSFIATHCLAIIPSSSYTPKAPKYHLYFMLDKQVTARDTYQAIASEIGAKIAVETDPALNRVSQGVYGTVYLNIDKKPAINDGMYYVNDNASPIDTLAIVKSYLDKHRATLASERLTTSHRTEIHHSQPNAIKLRVTLEAIDYAFRGWGRRAYDDWLAVCFSAYDASEGDVLALDAILAHDDIDWDSDRERADFSKWWNGIAIREDGYTAATLFYYARLNGWLAHSSVEINDGDTVKIYTQDLREWIADSHSANELPPKAIIRSNTGTAKTLSMIELVKSLGIPKSLFLAPSIKLCMALSATLEANGVPNTLYIDSGITKDRNTLLEANVLVTTLQTFAIKLLQNGVNVSDYKFCAIDESDELIGAFARSYVGGTIGYGSHVNKTQSFWGFKALDRIVNEVDYVYLLDATATRVTVDTINAMASDRFTVYDNEYIRSKCPVVMVNSLHYIRQIAVNAVATGQTVVFASDTRKEAKLFYEYLILNGLVDSDEIIMITGETHHDSKVIDFLRDVEAGAKQYRVVIYNSAMGSGVSITQTVPDVFIQVGGYVSPRKNLQILNRYRQQKRVYVHIPKTETLYGETANEKLARLDSVKANEVSLVGLSFIERDKVATMISHTAMLSVQDEIEQRYSAIDFYTRLLNDDGRVVTYDTTSDMDEAIINRYKEASAALRDRAIDIRSTWHTVEPIDRTNPPTADTSLDDIARGVLRSYIESVVKNWHLLGKEPLEIAELVLSYGKQVKALELWLDNQKALTKSVVDMIDNQKAFVTLRMHVSRLELISIVGILFSDSGVVLTADDLEPKIAKFFREVELRQHVYNTIAPRREYYYDNLINDRGKSGDTAIVIAKYILQSIGLTIRKKTVSRSGKRYRAFYIDRTDDLLAMVKARGKIIYIDSVIRFDSDAILQLSMQAHRASKKIGKLGDKGYRVLADRLNYMGSSYEETVHELFEAF